MTFLSTKKKNGSLWSHMFCSDLNKLHNFTKRLGISRHYFEKSNSGIYHYDVKCEFVNGAIQLPTKVILKNLGEWWNWNTRSLQKLLPKGLRVQISLHLQCARSPTEEAFVLRTNSYWFESSGAYYANGAHMDVQLPFKHRVVGSNPIVGTIKESYCE